MTSADKSAYGEKDAFGGQEAAATCTQIIVDYTRGGCRYFPK